jgi:N-acetylglucosamine-6-sulfatase
MLEQNDVINTTFFLYSSDHGYKQGQWRIGTSKQHPYETDIRVPFILRGPGVAAGGNFTKQIAGNVDVLPTMLHLAAGSDYVRAAGMDGRSMASFMVEGVSNSEDSVEDRVEGSGAEKPWRDFFLNEYLSCGTYWNDHSAIWQDGNFTTEHCNGDPKRGPNNPSPFKQACNESDGVGDGNCWFLDSTQSNSWRQLRVMNATMNWNYVEYDPLWNFDTFPLQHYELYDVSKDPYQMNNIYMETSGEVKASLHAQLQEYYHCKGESCP